MLFISYSIRSTLEERDWGTFNSVASTSRAVVACQVFYKHGWIFTIFPHIRVWDTECCPWDVLVEVQQRLLNLENHLLNLITFALESLEVSYLKTPLRWIPAMSKSSEASPWAAITQWQTGLLTEGMWERRKSPWPTLSLGQQSSAEPAPCLDTAPLPEPPHALSLPQGHPGQCWSAVVPGSTVNLNSTFQTQAWNSSFSGVIPSKSMDLHNGFAAARRKSGL